MAGSTSYALKIELFSFKIDWLSFSFKPTKNLRELSKCQNGDQAQAINKLLRPTVRLFLILIFQKHQKYVALIIQVVGVC